MEREGVPLRGAIARDGLAIAKLHRTLFDDVVAGRLPEKRAVVIGRSDFTPEEQLAFVHLLEQREAKGKRLTNAARELGCVILVSAEYCRRQKPTTRFPPP